jgi:hypothetical protein
MDDECGAFGNLFLNSRRKDIMEIFFCSEIMNLVGFEPHPSYW